MEDYIRIEIGACGSAVVEAMLGALGFGCMNMSFGYGPAAGQTRSDQSHPRSLRVLLGTPVAVFGAFAALWARGMENNIYAQIGLVMLIGLAAKNAILIVEFAKLARERGTPLMDAALEGARLRLRPIIMTSFAFILGCVPLWMASGSGAVAR